jgi:hypothetical protein
VEKNPDPGSGIRDDIPDLIFVNLVFWVKNIKILWCRSGSGMEKIGYGILDPGPSSRIRKTVTTNIFVQNLSSSF